MADIRSNADVVAFALAAANNQSMLDNIGTKFHLQRYETVDATDWRNPVITRGITDSDVTVDTVAWALLNKIKRIADIHFTDAIAHDTATSATVTIADATDTASAVSLANEIKANANTHYTTVNVHFTDDATNTITNADATDDPTMQVLVNELKNIFVNTHMQSAPIGTYINVVPA